MSEPRSIWPASPKEIIAKVIQDAKSPEWLGSRPMPSGQIAARIIEALEANDIDLVWRTTDDEDDSAK